APPLRVKGSGAMLDAKAYKAHFPDDPAYALPPGVPRQLNSAGLMEALAALEAEFRDILRQSTPEERGRAPPQAKVVIAGLDPAIVADRLAELGLSGGKDRSDRPARPPGPDGRVPHSRCARLQVRWPKLTSSISTT